MGAKEKILSNAAKLFHANGFNNTSIQDILDAASVTRNNLYYHFDSKEQLGFEVLNQMMRSWWSHVVESSLDNRELRPIERMNMVLNRILTIGVSRVGERGCVFGNLAQEMSYIHEPFRQSLSEFFHKVTVRLEECFEEGKSAGDFRNDLPSSELAEFVYAQIQGSFLLRKTHKDPKIMERNIEMLRHLIEEWS